MYQMNNSADMRTLWLRVGIQETVDFFDRENILGLLNSDLKSQTKALGWILKRMNKTEPDTAEWY